MFRVNENYLKLPGSYLFSTIAKKVAAYQKENPDKKLIRLGIGDVTLPIAPAIIDAMHKAVDEMGHAETFHGYAPDLGYAFLRETIEMCIRDRPGTRIPETSPNFSSTFSEVTVSESTHLMCTCALLATAPCFNASTTEI